MSDVKCWHCADSWPPCHKYSEEDAAEKTASISDLEKAGYLYTISSKSFLNREKWKRRYFALDGTKLYRSHKKEDMQIDPKGRYISLECYDVHLLTDIKDDNAWKNWKRDHVFVLIMSEVMACNEKTRHVFSADTREELADWVAKLRLAVSRTRELRRPQRPPRSKVTSLPAICSSLKSSKEAHGSSCNNAADGHLYNPNKYRVRGPKGRRLPKKKYRSSMVVGDHFRSSSLCELDMDDEDVEDAPCQLPQEAEQTARTCSNGNLAYQYSSSEDSNGFWKSKETDKDEKITAVHDRIDLDDNGAKQSSVQETEVLVTVDMKDEVDAQKTQEQQKQKVTGYRYQGYSPDDNMDFFGQLADKLKTMNGSLTRFRDEINEELQSIGECLNATSTGVVAHHDSATGDSVPATLPLDGSSSHQAAIVLKVSIIICLACAILFFGYLLNDWPEIASTVK